MKQTLTLGDSASTVNLNNQTSSFSDRWTPSAPLVDSVKVTPQTDGGELPATYYRNVTESIRINFKDPTTALAQKLLVQAFLDQARQRQSNRGIRQVNLTWNNDPAEGFTTWTFEVLAGVVGDVNMDQMLAGSWAWFTLTFTRRYFGETTELLPTGTAVTVYNQALVSAARYNYFTAQSLSVVATPAAVEIKNTYNVGTDAAEYIVGVGSWDGVTALIPPTIEGESGTYSASTSTQSLATCSNGQYAQMQWAGTNEVLVWSGIISQAQLIQCGFDRHRILAIVPGAPTSQSCRMRAQLVYASGAVVWAGEPVNASTTVAPASPLGGIIDLGDVVLPPRSMAGIGSPAPLTLQIYARDVSGAGTHTIPLDFIYLMPARSYRVIRGGALPYNCTVIDRPVQRLLYSTGHADGTHAQNYPDGEPITLLPGYNRIHVLNKRLDNVQRSSQVLIKYSPRSLGGV